MLQLRREHIKQEDIKLTIKKTKEVSIVALNGYAVDILNKYKDRLSPLPMIANQNFNKYVK
ncbi:hypothetical protein EL17_06120 [Anditalea andensis]|uniref:Uncharacterized protein n=1 Tax=Anditalea andensis TaxID=1048983 RepID=A0A074LMW3_9BACT|nr:hypothetical protein EL17_06120 [Anditalea andensis]